MDNRKKDNSRWFIESSRSLLEYLSKFGEVDFQEPSLYSRNFNYAGIKFITNRKIAEGLSDRLEPLIEEGLKLRYIEWGEESENRVNYMVEFVFDDETPINNILDRYKREDGPNEPIEGIDPEYQKKVKKSINKIRRAIKEFSWENCREEKISNRRK